MKAISHVRIDRSKLHELFRRKEVVQFCYHRIILQMLQIINVDISSRPIPLSVGILEMFRQNALKLQILWELWNIWYRSQFCGRSEIFDKDKIKPPSVVLWLFQMHFFWNTLSFFLQEKNVTSTRTQKIALKMKKV